MGTGLDEKVPYLPEIMSEAGYGTCGIVNVFQLNHDFGFDRGFDQFVFSPDGNGKAAESVDSLIVWLSDNGDEPFFVLFHLFDPHMPYSPPSPFDTLYAIQGDTVIAHTWIQDGNAPVNPERLDHFLSLYDGEITWVDSQLSRLFAEMRDRGLVENTVIILTADHGEEFLEHGGVGHGHTLYEEMIHVPLIVSGPGFERGVRS